MNRKECYEYIKAHEDLRNYFIKKYGNFTNVKTDTLIDEINDYKGQHESLEECFNKNIKCVDDGARKAILAIATIFKLKNIERNFN